MSGEEAGAEGRLFANIVTGANAGNSYELPFLGKFSWENALASPQSSDKTVIIGTDDATPGQVYVYVGEKTNAGNEIEKAGLSNGKLFGVSVNGLSTESSSSIPSAETGFSLVDIGAIVDSTGAQLESISKNKGVTTFLRPEDGAWDPNSPNDFYFATTNSFTSPSRLWRLRFADAINPEAGGTITAVLDGSEGQKMMDNLTIDKYGHILIQEDPGNQSHLAAVWQYDINTDNLIKIAEHDASRFVNNSQTGYLTQDEESSGIIDMHDILGPGHFLLTDQAHYTIPGELVEGGQLLTFFNPDTISNKLYAEVKTTNESVCGANDGSGIVEVKGGVKPFTYQWTKNKQIVATNSNLSHGIDTVVITDKIGNKFHATAKVGYNALPNVEFEKTDVLCYNGFGSVKIKSNEVLNAYNFNWSNLKNGLNNDSVKAGIISVTGINGECKITGFVTVTEPSKIMAKAEVIEAIACFGDTAKIKLSASGGIAPYSLDGDTLVKSGKHSFVAIDANGCVSDSVYAVITEPSKLIANAQIAQAIKCNGETAKIQINSTGGLSPYEVKGNLTVSSGRHSYVSVDANGCNSDSVYIDVTEPSKILAKAELTEAIKCYGGEAKIDVTAQGGVAPYSVKGNTNVKSGQHSYFVVDANGCNSELALIEVSQPAKLVGKAELSSEIKCFGDTAKIKLSASGGIAPYNLDGDTLVKSGKHSFVAIDANGCVSDSVYAVITEPSKLIANAQIAQAIKCNGETAKIQINSTGGLSPYEVKGNLTVSSGRHSYVSVDANGCNSDSVYIDVTEPSKILAKAELTEAIKCYGGEAKIDVTAQGGVAPYSVKGNTNVKSGQHSYFVVDANGCNSELALIEVSQPAKLVGKAELSSEIKCFGDTAKIKLAASGGSSPYSFNGDTLVKSGIYKYFVVDSKGCKADTFQISVSQPEKLEIKTSVIDATNDKNADGKAIVITNGGHTPYSYQWDKLNEKTEIATVGKGVYKVTVIDAKGCKINADLTVGAGTLGVNNLEISGLSIYPNPTSGQVFISFNSISESKVELVDISGKVINSDSSNGSVNVSFDLSELSSGVYFIKIQNMDGVFIQKLMKN